MTVGQDSSAHQGKGPPEKAGRRLVEKDGQEKSDAFVLARL